MSSVITVLVVVVVLMVAIGVGFYYASRPKTCTVDTDCDPLKCQICDPTSKTCVTSPTKTGCGCSSTSDCQAGEVCSLQKCVPSSSLNPVQPSPPPTMGESCSDQLKCATGLTCVDGKCASTTIPPTTPPPVTTPPPTTVPPTTPPTTLVPEYASCMSTAQCVTGLRCVSGRCLDSKKWNCVGDTYTPTRITAGSDGTTSTVDCLAENDGCAWRDSLESCQTAANAATTTSSSKSCTIPSMADATNFCSKVRKVWGIPDIKPSGSLDTMISQRFMMDLPDGSQRCIEVAGAGGALHDDAIQTYTCNDSIAQKFTYNPFTEQISTASSPAGAKKCLTVDDTQTLVIQRNCSENTASQKWSYYKDSRQLVPKINGYLDTQLAPDPTNANPNRKVILKQGSPWPVPLTEQWRIVA